MINVTKSFLPPIEEYYKYVQGIWERGHLTNHGPLVNELEEKLKAYLGVKHFFFVNNGTIAIQIAIKALGLQGKVITTPFSYVATTSSLVWEGLEPVMADISNEHLNIEPEKIESLITPDVSGILATHVYGIPCRVHEITELADRYNLKVIYDAAHAFGVQAGGEGILNFGDISTLSFHATKLFHTIEGGGIATNSDDLAHRISYMRNFGHKGQEDFWGLGINGKNCEFHAAMGLSLFPYLDSILDARKERYEMYRQELKSEKVKFIAASPDDTWNYAYCPVLFDSEKDLLQVRDALNSIYVYPRRYFYPSLSSLNYVGQQATPVSDDISKRVLCLPLYPDLPKDSIRRIASTIKDIIMYS